MPIARANGITMNYDRRGSVRSWKPNPSTACPFIVPITCMGPEK